jgi:hypothetical protein
VGRVPTRWGHWSLWRGRLPAHAADMTDALVTVTTAVLRQAAVRAVQAPSIHNTQPWTFVLAADRLDIHIDPERRLSVLDPRGRQLMISCGCALLNARVAIAAAGHQPIVQRFPDPANPNLVARLSVGDVSPAGRDAALDLAIDQRRTNRRAFMDEPVPRSFVTKLVAAVRAEGAVLVPVTSPSHRAAVAELTALAARLENEDPQYLAEILTWTTDDPRRPDGVQAASMPYEADRRGGPTPIRSFDVRGMGWLPPARNAGRDDCLLVLCSDEDEPAAWLRAGEALERMWLELTDHGYWASPMTQVVEVRATHDRLREELGITAHPQLLLRVGRAPEAMRTPRRREQDVIVDA